MKIAAKITTKLARQILTARKYSPQILFGAGVVGAVTSTVLACKATMKLDGVLDDFKSDVDSIAENNSVPRTKDYTDSDHRKHVAYVYTKNSMAIAKLYAPSVILGVASIGALTGSHVTLTRRNAGLTAAYAALDRGFNEYRARVEKELGKESEENARYSIDLAEIKIDEKTELVRRVDPNKLSVYARLFDETNLNYQKNAEVNRLFVQCQQNYLNHRLHAMGHVFLNEAYDALGMERSAAGQVVGWVLNNGGDNYIDFNMFEVENSKFINNMERCIMLDFNVDGVVYNLI